MLVLAYGQAFQLAGQAHPQPHLLQVQIGLLKLLPALISFAFPGGEQRFLEVQSPVHQPFPQAKAVSAGEFLNLGDQPEQQVVRA